MNSLHMKKHFNLAGTKILKIFWLLFLVQNFFFSSLFCNPLNQALSVVQSRALKGDSHYQGALALFHKFGERGLSVDLEEAERWATLSAEKNGALGLCTLAALSLERGKSERGQFLYDEAYLHSNLLSLAKGKDPLALYCLGMMEMDNPPRNFTKAIRHLEASAEKGFSTAQATLGMIFFTGIGVKKDSTIALKWCSRAAGSSHPLGMFYLGMAYSIGDGIEKNDDYSVRWIHAAASRDLVMAQLTLGMKLATGDGIEKNLQKAVTWLHKASLGGSSEAKLQLRKYQNHLERLRNPTAKYIPDEQNNGISRIAANNLKSIKENNSTNIIANFDAPNETTTESSAEFDLIDAAMNVLTVEKNRQKAKTLLESIASKGNPVASRQLGLIFYKENKFDDAKKWFNLSAEKNDPESLRYMGILYFLGQGVKLDYKAADKWLTLAAQNGDLEATRYLRVVKQFY